jgi:hypothetical protein
MMALKIAGGSPTLRIAAWYCGQAFTGGVALCAGPAGNVSVATMNATTKRLITVTIHVSLFLPVRKP